MSFCGKPRHGWGFQRFWYSFSFFVTSFNPVLMVHFSFGTGLFNISHLWPIFWFPDVRFAGFMSGYPTIHLFHFWCVYDAFKIMKPLRRLPEKCPICPINVPLNLRTDFWPFAYRPSPNLWRVWWVYDRFLNQSLSHFLTHLARLWQEWEMSLLSPLSPF